MHLLPRSNYTSGVMDMFDDFSETFDKRLFHSCRVAEKCSLVIELQFANVCNLNSNVRFSVNGSLAEVADKCNLGNLSQICVNLCALISLL